jgi:hypothetical protein
LEDHQEGSAAIEPQTINDKPQTGEAVRKAVRAVRLSA